MTNQASTVGAIGNVLVDWTKAMQIGLANIKRLKTENEQLKQQLDEYRKDAMLAHQHKSQSEYINNHEVQKAIKW